MWNEELFLEIFEDEDLEQQHENDEEYQEWRYFYVNGEENESEEDKFFKWVGSLPVWRQFAEIAAWERKNQPADEFELLASDPVYLAYIRDLEAEASLNEIIEKEKVKQYGLH